jgi:phosphodiesterase/alkaline phosphatase D-like protein
LEREPDVWIWGGDNIYADKLVSIFPRVTFEPATLEDLKTSYALQQQEPGYVALLATGVPVVSTWDDHDFGINDGDKRFARKRESQQEFLKFVNEPKDSPRWGQQGVYASRHFEFASSSPKGQKKGFVVAVIALDLRYHKDPYSCALGAATKNDCDFLGQVQWDWLERELASSPADAHVIVSSLQLLEARQHIGELQLPFILHCMNFANKRRPHASFRPLVLHSAPPPPSLPIEQTPSPSSLPPFLIHMHSTLPKVNHGAGFRRRGSACWPCYTPQTRERP